MGCAAVVSQCISMEVFTRLVTSAAHPTPACVCECTIRLVIGRSNGGLGRFTARSVRMK